MVQFALFCLTRRCFSFVGRPVCFVLSHETLFFLCGLTTSHRFTATHATLDASLTQVLLNKGLIWPYSPYKTLQSQVAVTCCTLGLYVRHLDCFWSLLSHFGASWVLAGHVAEYFVFLFSIFDMFVFFVFSRCYDQLR